MISATQVLERHNDLKATRALVEPQWRDLAKLFQPEDADMFNGNNKNRVYDDIFDATQLYALESFSGGIFGQLTNPTNRWFSLTLPDKDLAKYQPVRAWLRTVEDVIYASISPAVSNFYNEVPAWLADLGCFGMGVLYQEESLGKGRIIDRCIPLSESYIALDADGDVDTFHRSFKLRGDMAKRKYPELAALGPAVNDRSEYVFVHAVMPNPEFQPGRLGTAGAPYLSVTVCEQLKAFQRIRSYRDFPYATVMWKRRAGRTYPVGPGHMALPDVSMLQEMERTNLVAAQFAAEPPTLAPDEAAFTAADIVPNALLYGAVNERGQALAQTLNRGQNLNLSNEAAERRRQAIREAFYFGVMQLVNRPQMTATEFLGFQEENLRLMAPNLARVQSQGLSPYLQRRYRILDRAGQLPEPPEELDGQRLELDYVSPLAKLQKAGEARAVLGWVAGVSQLAQATGDSGALDNIDVDAASAVLHEAYGPPPIVQRDPRKVEEIRANRAALAQRQTQLEQQGQEVEIAATAAHAAQAATLSDGRAAA